MTDKEQMYEITHLMLGHGWSSEMAVAAWKFYANHITVEQLDRDYPQWSDEIKLYR